MVIIIRIAALFFIIPGSLFSFCLHNFLRSAWHSLPMILCHSLYDVCSNRGPSLWLHTGTRGSSSSRGE